MQCFLAKAYTEQYVIRTGYHSWGLLPSGHTESKR